MSRFVESVISDVNDSEIENDERGELAAKILNETESFPLPVWKAFWDNLDKTVRAELFNRINDVPESDLE